MKITIGHLYYDILNLYGESGNILALKYALEKQGCEVIVKEFSLTDDLDLNDLDFVYIGAGTEQNQLLALNHLKKYAASISQAILNNKMFLVTGNSIELFGSHIMAKEEKLETLGIFNYYTERTDKRLVSECVFKNEKINDLILGFENHQGITKMLIILYLKLLKAMAIVKIKVTKDTSIIDFMQHIYSAQYLQETQCYWNILQKNL